MILLRGFLHQLRSDVANCEHIAYLTAGGIEPGRFVSSCCPISKAEHRDEGVRTDLNHTGRSDQHVGAVQMSVFDFVGFEIAEACYDLEMSVAYPYGRPGAHLFEYCHKFGYTEVVWTGYNVDEGDRNTLEDEVAVALEAERLESEDVLVM